MSVPAGEAAGRFGRLWERGRIGAPTRGAAWTRCLVVTLFTLAGAVGSAVLWSLSSRTGPLEIASLLPAVLTGAVAMTMLLYWLHGGLGQCLLFMPLYLVAALAGGSVAGDLAFAAHGVAGRGTVSSCVERATVRTRWLECRVRLDDGRTLSRPIRTEPGEHAPGERVTVSYVPDGAVAPVFGDRTHGGVVLPGVAGGALALSLLTVVAGARTGEHLRRRGAPSAAQRPNPSWYPRRVAAGGR